MIDYTKPTTFKCRKCRHLLFLEEQISNCHNEPLFPLTNDNQSCNPRSNVWYLREESFPDWVKEQVNDGNWMKGKIFCPFCKCRLGSFDFVSGNKCTCETHVLPPLHVVSCKLDYIVKTSLDETNVTESHTEQSSESNDLKAVLS
ncbi:E3 ubiquitin-protein ligase RNF180-like [Parasteatoda tepidariorum]|nr:E3 ubiquitin-protein ligase RNF180-like [Parasteatoda tepidariorum]